MFRTFRESFKSKYFDFELKFFKAYVSILEIVRILRNARIIRPLLDQYCPVEMFALCWSEVLIEPPLCQMFSSLAWLF